MRNLVYFATVTIILLILLLTSCELGRPDHIIAGDQGRGVRYDCCIDQILNCKDFGSHVAGKEYSIKFQGDDESAFTIFATSAGGQGGSVRKIGIKSINENYSISILKSGSDYIQLRHEGDIIGDNLCWSSADKSYYFLHISSGYDNQQDQPFHRVNGIWNEVTDGYLAVRIIDGGDTRYGWVRLDVYDESIIHIYDYAIQK